METKLSDVLQNPRVSKCLDGCCYWETARTLKTKALICDEYRLNKLINQFLDSKVHNELIENKYVIDEFNRTRANRITTSKSRNSNL